MRLLRVLVTRVSLGDIARLLDLPYEEVLRQAQAIYSKLAVYQ
jgi:hypothetical protein